MNLRKHLSVVLCSVMLALPALAGAQEDDSFPTTPTTNDGKKWRVATYEGGPYVNYVRTLDTIIQGLMKLGWIEQAVLPEATSEETKPLWDWLVNDAKSDYLEFVADGHYSANWDNALRTKMAAELVERLNSKKDIDLVIASGSWAGKDLANDQHSTPTVVTSTSNPVSSGIIKSVDDSGFPHLHARVDPRRHERQLTVFHEIIDFKTLGVAYEDSTDGRVYAAMDVVEKLARDRGFTISECHTKSDVKDQAVAEKSVVDCFDELSNKVEAVYITQQGGVTPRSVPQIVEMANTKSVATFSQTGSREVKLGVLLSLSRINFRDVGLFHGSVMAKIFNGASPGKLGQLFEEPPKIAINLRSAELIGFDPPVVLLGAADEIYDQIESAE